MITVLLLAERPESIPILARWHHAQWPDYSGSQTVEDAERRIRAWMNRDRLPIGLAAYLDGQLAGAAVLRENAMGSRPDFGPGLGALLVAEPFRRRGVAT